MMAFAKKRKDETCDTLHGILSISGTIHLLYQGGSAKHREMAGSPNSEN